MVCTFKVSGDLDKKIFESLTQNQLGDIPVIQKNVSLDLLKQFSGVADVMDLAKSEALLASHGEHQKKVVKTEYYQIAYKTSQLVLRYLLVNVAGYINSLVYNLIGQFTGGYFSLALLLSMREYMQDLVESLNAKRLLIHAYVKEFIEMRLPAGNQAPLVGTMASYAVQCSIVLTCAWLYYLSKVYNLKLSSRLRDMHFEDLTEKARLGELAPTIGGSEYAEALITHLSSTPFQKGVTVFLIGPPGVGKTQSVSNLATRIARGDVPALQGKSIVSINTSEITSDRGSMKETIDYIFYLIQEQEDRLILFFDEAHVMHKENGEDSLLQLFKTKIQERNISIILATTQAEYDKHIAPDKAFESRTRPIIFKEPDDKTVKLILQKASTNLGVEIETQALDKIIEIMKAKTDQFNPRKSLNALEDCIKHLANQASTALTNTPNSVSNQEQELTSLIVECRDLSEKDPHWLNTEDAQMKLQQIETLKSAIEASKEARKEAYQKQAHHLSLIQLHKEVKGKSEKLACRLTTIPEGTSEYTQLQKEYLFTKFYLAPQISKACSYLSIPYKIDVAFVEKCLK